MPNLNEHVRREYQARLSYIESNRLEAYRLANPGFKWPFAVDIYKDSAVVHLFEPVSAALMSQLEDAVKKNIGISDFFYKDRTKDGLEVPKKPHREIIVTESGHRFLINLSDYRDVGLFLDHRETRRWVEKQSKGKTVLNTFAYTGSFSIYAAKGGAAKTFSVDLSKTYCEWIKKNLELNNLPSEKNWVYKMDTLEFFHYAAKKGLKFDIIIIDPPTFSKNKQKNFSVQKDHPLLIRGALEVLNQDGMILFSNNFQKFRMDAGLTEECVIKPKNLIPTDFAGTIPHQLFIISLKKVDNND